MREAAGRKRKIKSGLKGRAEPKRRAVKAKHYPLFLVLLGLFALYHSNLRNQGPPSETLDLQLVNFSLLKGDGFNIAPVTRTVVQKTGFPESLGGHDLQEKTYPTKPAFTALPFLPIYAAWYWLKLPVNLFWVNFLGKFSSVLYALVLLAALFRTAVAVTGRQGLALFAVIAFGTGTHVWHSVSQGLWSSTGFVCFFGIGLYVLSKSKRDVWDLVLAGSAFGYAVACRPQDGILIAPFVLWVLLSRDLRKALTLCAPIVLISALTLLMNKVQFGSFLGTYDFRHGYSTNYQIALTGIVPSFRGNWLEWPKAAAGLLVSPSRGLLIFSPILLLAFIGYVRRLPRVIRKREFEIIDAAALSFILHFLFIAKYNLWWGGYAWGPRLLAVALPSLFIVFVGTFPKKLGQLSKLAVVALLAWSVFVQGLAAYKYHLWQWNWSPVDVDRQPSRVWEIKDSQILRAIGEEWLQPNWKTYSSDY